MRYVPGLWNGIWIDMFIKTTFVHALWAWQTMHYCVTLKLETLKLLSLSLHICSRLEQDLSSFLYSDNNTELTGHKEESKGRVSGDKAIRESIKRKLQE